MNAMPMRVIADAPARTVLYQAPDTAFRGARTPAGAKIRDFSAEWVEVAPRGHLPLNGPRSFAGPVSLCAAGRTF
jgi:hypothetical protein